MLGDLGELCRLSLPLRCLLSCAFLPCLRPWEEPTFACRLLTPERLAVSVGLCAASTRPLWQQPLASASRAASPAPATESLCWRQSSPLLSVPQLQEWAGATAGPVRTFPRALALAVFKGRHTNSLRASPRGSCWEKRIYFVLSFKGGRVLA